MPPLVFARNDSPTIGVELELQLVSAETLELVNGIESVLAAVPEEFHGHVKPELIQCSLEINTGICRNVQEVREDL